MVNLVANTSFLYLFTDIFGVHYLISQVIASILVAMWSFFIYRIMFSDKKDESIQKAKKVLFITQKVDLDDSVLGAYHHWIEELSKKFESIVVICLEKGRSELPPNVKVLSLGKEERQSRLQYLIHFYWYILTENKNYDAVFVHMNQEYVVLGALPWRFTNKTIYMWRNHVSGSVMTKIAVRLCDKVFCTSEFSYTARYKKTVIMPVGIDTNMFQKKEGIKKIPRSILFLGRMGPIKKPHFLTEALILLDKKGVDFKASYYGNAYPHDKEYYASLQQKVIDNGLSNKVSFHAAIPNYTAPDVYNAHEISINLSPNGLYDKTIFEAMSCETMMVASSKSLYGLIREDFIFKEGNVEDLAHKLEKLLDLSSPQKKVRGVELRKVVLSHHSLDLLMNEFREQIL